MYTFIRVVCQNTLFAALGDGRHGFPIPLTADRDKALDLLKTIVREARHTAADTDSLFRAMADAGAAPGLIAAYIGEVKRHAAALAAGGDWAWDDDAAARIRAQLGAGPTLWEAYNAVTRYEDYRIVPGETAEDRLERVWFGIGAQLKLAALEAARELLVGGPEPPGSRLLAARR